jgi:hypothetical protein
MDLFLKDTIGIIPNAFSDELCDKILKLYYTGMLKDQLYDGLTGLGVNHSIKNSKDWQLIGCGLDGEAECVAEIQKTFIEHVGSYCGSFPHQDKIDRHYMFSDDNYFEVYQVQRYKANEGHYNSWHCESGNFSMSKRIFAFLVYLNDVKEGGETEFLYANMKIQPKKGTLLVHPAGYPYFHKGNMPISDDKHILISWLSYSPPKN